MSSRFSEERILTSRGDIYFVDKFEKKILMATTINGRHLVLSPNVLGDSEEIYEHINEVVPIDRERVPLKRLETRPPHTRY